jgi:penicillin-binding protein 1C
MVMDTRTGAVLAYIGNVPQTNKNDGGDVDIITSARSTGSIMKPFLYALMQDEGILLPQQCVPDIPTTILGYRPENFNHTFDGVIPANIALYRSLNIPAVRELNEYGVARFHQKLNDWGITTIQKSPSYYGLPLILGGAEANLWDLMGIYSSMGRTLSHFTSYESRYDKTDWRAAHYIYDKKTTPCNSFMRQRQAPKVGAGAIWITFDAMRQVERPTTEGSWEVYESTRPIAWKTGTSWGGRDAWAIGVTPEYTIGVWIGNADGEGRPGLIGATTAAPVLFDLFNTMPATTWWQAPFDDLRSTVVCHKSGFLPSRHCTDLDTIWATPKADQAKNCPFHQLVTIDKKSQLRVNATCESIDNIIQQSFFVLQPLEEQYYKQHHPDFIPLPPFRTDCQTTAAPTLATGDNAPMQWVYPRNPTKIFVPISIDGTPQQTVFELAHHQPTIKVFWYLDDNFLGTTTNYHQQALRPSMGKHKLVATDANGTRLEQIFEVVSQ